MLVDLNEGFTDVLSQAVILVWTIIYKFIKKTLWGSMRRP